MRQAKENAHLGREGVESQQMGRCDSPHCNPQCLTQALMREAIEALTAAIAALPQAQTQRKKTPPSYVFQQHRKIAAYLRQRPRTAEFLKTHVSPYAVTRISEMRRKGYRITTQMVPLRSQGRRPTTQALYTLMGEPK